MFLQHLLLSEQALPHLHFLSFISPYTFRKAKIKISANLTPIIIFPILMLYFNFSLISSVVIVAITNISITFRGGYMSCFSLLMQNKSFLYIRGTPPMHRLTKQLKYRVTPLTRLYHRTCLYRQSPLHRLSPLPVPRRNLYAIPWEMCTHPRRDTKLLYWKQHFHLHQ